MSANPLVAPEGRLAIVRSGRILRPPVPFGRLVRKQPFVREHDPVPPSDSSTMPLARQARVRSPEQHPLTSRIYYTKMTNVLKLTHN